MENDSPRVKITTDGTEEDHIRAIEALNLILSSHQVSAATKHIALGACHYTLKESVDDYRKERYPSIKPRTHQAWNTDFKQLVDGLGESTPLHLINVDAYTNWRIRLVDVLAPSSQDSKNNVYKNFFDWCVQRNRCKSNPVVPCKLGKKGVQNCNSSWEENAYPIQLKISKYFLMMKLDRQSKSLPCIDSL